MGLCEDCSAFTFVSSPSFAPRTLLTEVSLHLQEVPNLNYTSQALEYAIVAASQINTLAASYYAKFGLAYTTPFYAYDIFLSGVVWVTASALYPQHPEYTHRLNECIEWLTEIQPVWPAAEQHRTLLSRSFRPDETRNQYRGSDFGLDSSLGPNQPLTSDSNYLGGPGLPLYQPEVQAQTSSWAPNVMGEPSPRPDFSHYPFLHEGSAPVSGGTGLGSGSGSVHPTHAIFQPDASANASGSHPDVGQGPSSAPGFVPGASAGTVFEWLLQSGPFSGIPGSTDSRTGPGGPFA